MAEKHCEVAEEHLKKRGREALKSGRGALCSRYAATFISAQPLGPPTHPNPPVPSKPTHPNPPAPSKSLNQVPCNNSINHST